ncbi:MAG: sigma-70 family RNA polymerase sigma factor [Planctomycetaceae bacterium]|nr:sigma-70 family RNA polymerase sigma factor [Planctomycetota bacterium]NUN51490.1 sigma-70 family RNA polymerase sigma factor [Planctomycetaceae bacterium]
MAKEDEELVRAAQQGAGPEAQRAFAALVDRWQAPVLRVAARRLRDHRDSEEVAADTFVRAWKALHTLRDPATFPGWILRIAENRALSRLRRLRVKYVETPLDRLLLDPEAPTVPVGLWQDLENAFGDIPEPQLDLLRWKHEDGLSYAEIAERLGVSVSTVRDRLVEARTSIESTLRRHGLIEEFARLLEQRKKHRSSAADPYGVGGSGG